MPLPPAVAARLGEALSALHRHPQRTLLPWYRHAIYTALSAHSLPTGLHVRAWLEIATVQHLLFCWQPRAWATSWPQPEHLVALAEQMLVGATDRAHAGAQLNRAQAFADVVGEPDTSIAYCTWCVYEAALRTLHSAYQYDQWRAVSVTAPASIDAIGCMDDASTYAAIAVGGGTWSPDGATASDPGLAVGRWEWQTPEAQLRRAVFWEWWLREAIPSAWRKA